MKVFPSGRTGRDISLHSVFLLAALIWCGVMSAERYYVSPRGAGDGSSWQSPTTLADALSKAKANDEIWVQGFASTDRANYYVAPAEGFTLRSGVRLYGGFAGTEATLGERDTDGRAFGFTCRTVLSGDRSGNDDVTGHSSLIFPENDTRADNAVHVLTLDLEPTAESANNNRYATVVNGFTIAGGHADADGENGGGIYVKGSKDAGAGAYRIERCFFTDNYGGRGGAVYVDANAVQGADPSLISQCAMFNNAAGRRAVEENAGGAVCLDGYGVVVNTSIFNNENGGILMADGCRVVNSTVTRNTGSGISISGSSAEVWNTVVWGNDALFDSGSTSPQFHHSAYPEVTADDANNNIRISVSNRETGVPSPHFESPSTRAGYDVEYHYTHAAYPLWAWALLEGSALIDKGDDNAYNDDNGTSPYGTSDLALASRFSGTVDIGAYEFQPTPAGRILRVAPDGSDANDGSSWSAAFRSVQAAIDRLASTGNGRGEVWVKAGTYSPTSLLASGDQLTAAFIMRDGVSVYGGFAGTENSRAERKLKPGGMPWEFENVTTFQASGYMDAASWNAADLKWSIVSSSNHVVWFDGTEPVADGYKDFSTVTVLDGVTVCGGRASLARASVYCGDRGAGLYMDNANARLVNCIVTQNVAEGPGGGVYLGGGRIESSLLFNNSSDADGGAVYVDNSGLVLRSMLTNNAAGNGAAVCLARNGDYIDGDPHPEYLILSTSVVSNNTARKNGAVYCDEGGVLTQNTIVNNSAPRALDATDPEATRTGGLFIDGYALVINNILWNNRANGTGVAGNDIPMYAANPTQSAVRFLSSAVSGMNNAVWNNTLQQSLTSLAASNTGTEGENNPDFSVGGAMSSDDALNTTVGVQPSWTAIDYFWRPQRGSNLRAVGMTLAAFPEEVLIAPELDIAGLLFSQKPSVGAHMIEQQSLSPERDGNVWRLYVDGNCTEPEHDGSSWATAYRSLNEAIDYFASLSETDVADVDSFEIYVYEGSYYPRYAFTGNDAKTATVSVKRMPAGKELVIRGGWSRDADPVYNPVLYRTVLDGNPDGSSLEEGLYHVFTVESGARFTLDGFHVVGGYAAGSSPVQYGAGMLVGDSAAVTLRNSFFENNTAVSGAAVDARLATLTLENCVINNNTNTTPSEPVVNAQDLTLNHVTVVRNVGLPYSSGAAVSNSFAAGNVDAAEGGSTVGDNLTFNAEWNTIFANPTNGFGAALGFDTYVGGYADFTPLTSSAESSQLINKGTASASTVDIAQRPRNLGGTPDLGAYEADLPEKGRVYYVRENGDDLNDGLSWNTAFQTIRMAVETAAKGEVIDGARPSVWVAAGNYAQDPLSGSNNCFDMADGVSVYGSFPKTGNPNMDERHPFISDVIYHDGTYSSADYETILRPATATNDVRRVLGQSDEYNPFMYVHPNYTEQTTSYVYVGAGNGDYDYSYTEQSGGGWIYSEKDGGFVDASADAADRLFHVTAPGYCPVDQADTPTHKYVTSVERTAYSGWNLDRWDPDGWGTGLDEKTFVYVGSGKGDYVITEESKGGWPYGDYSRYASNDNGDYVEFHGEDYYECVADVATHKYFSEGYHEVASRELWNTVRLVKGWNYVGSGHGTHSRGEIANVGTGNGSYKSVTASGKHFLYATVWDGFTIRDGYLNSDKIKFLGSNDHGVGGTRNGGAGVVLFSNVTLRNSVVYGSQNVSGSKPLRGGGIYCDGGSIVNCYILNSELRFNGTGEAYGGGCYMYSGTAYNCVINGNQTYGGSTDGAGIFIENAEFYNNTIVGNRSNGSARGNGGICIWQSGSSSKLTIYNCIVLGNEGYRQGTNNPIYGNKDIARQAGTIESYNSIFETTVNATGVVYDPTCKAVGSGNMNSIFAGYDGKNFRLAGGSPALNMGENVPQVNGKDIVLLDYTDMDFSDRIKDCTVDAGAYELDNKENISPDANGVYYVTIDGSGLANGSSPENAACEMKLQDILDAAGERAAGGQTAEVRIAGYKGAAADGYIYNATDLSDPDDPMSYTFTVPYGVTVKGGYSEDFNEDTRNALTYQTLLSPVATKGGQTVNGYHVVSFAEKTENSNYSQEGSIIDGLFLIDGKATSLAGAGNDDTRGGGAIVPAGAHVRNCVVMRNEAKFGGGLYLLPGAMVSGTVLRDNTASQGGAVYAEADEDGSLRSHLISVTVGGNSATSAGGGIYMEDGALMALNSVVHGNEAPTDLNVSGVVYEEFTDALIADVTDVDASTLFFPFNNCFVETYEMPSDLGNTSLESDRTLYFTDSHYTLKVYSELIKHGATSAVQAKLENHGVAVQDMQGITRQQGGDRIDAGAYAFEGEIMEVNNDVAYTLFVSQSENVSIADKAAADAFYGRSFFTSLTWLDDALEYIRQVRANNETARSRTFRILVSGGTYKPHFARGDANAPGHDLRQNSFEIPCNVEIYGGFSGKEQLTSYVGTAYNIDSILGQELEVVADDLSSVLGQRAYSDLNQNGVMEEYEFANQTILSGELEASEDESNVYHVIYSDVADNADVPEGKHTVKIDGVTVMGGVTHNELSPTGEENEVGRGGGIYSNGVNYVVNRCRLINNRAVHGGAVFVRDAMLSLVGSIVAGNSSVENAAGTADNHVGGGAVYLIGIANDPADEMSVLAAANTIFANNETSGHGGAVAAHGSEWQTGGTVNTDPIISMTNCMFVNNKAAEGEAAIYNTNEKSKALNTVFWGNVSGGDEHGKTIELIHCASDEIDNTDNGNVILAKENLSIGGPRFAQPSVAAGIAGNSAVSRWNPASISVLTDAGDGLLAEGVDDMSQATGGYAEWMQTNLLNYAYQYMSDGGYSRYDGPLNEDGSKGDKPIDIGVYEYQYDVDFSTLDTVYVALEESGTGSGTSWDNATSDLRGALIGLANSTGGKSEDKAVLIKEGDYTNSRLYSLAGVDVLYTINMSTDKPVVTKNLTVSGSYTESGQQDFSRPTVIMVADGAAKPDVLMNVDAQGKTVTLRGLTFDGSGAAPAATGLRTGSKGTVNIHNVAFRHNATGAAVSGGTALFANSLFADNATVGLSVTGGDATVVNSTFANNGAAITGAADAYNVYNSISWQSGNGITTDEDKHNYDFATADNADVMNGPNFVDPANGDYTIRPSKNILNKGSNDLYSTHVGVSPTKDKDLANLPRLTGNAIDLGAYEYGAPLQQLLYVRHDVVGGNADGTSWDNAIGDLQSAVDLAALYTEANEGNAYVFADRNVKSVAVNLAVSDVKVYGGMNNEVAAGENDDDKAASLISQRDGVIAADGRSTIDDLTVSAASLFDGFEVKAADVTDGAMLSTSVVGNVTVDGGTVYNSYVADTAGGSGSYVNVTSPSELPEGINNYPSAVANGYVYDDIWAYQPKETYENIDKAEQSSIQTYIGMVGHSRDLSGSQRVRNGMVDYGCFELWNITANTTVQDADRPSDRHVVYVREGVELGLGDGLYGAGSEFNPGFLLLEHGAGLLGNGNSVALTNFAVERNLTEANAYTDLASMPFTIEKTEVDGAEGLDGVTVSRYDGAARAAYDYRYDGANSTAWVALTDVKADRVGMEGLLLEAEADSKVRFYGNDYKEDAGDKAFVLTQHNHAEPWSSPDAESEKFTHAENMGWNLFGSPFLCTMNYEDMDYQRVIYVYKDKYISGLPTWNRESGTVQDGNIPAGSAVFTQTATLASSETVPVSHRAADVAEAAVYAGNLAVEFARADAGDEADADLIQITAVPAAESKSGFDVNADGVKWMNGKADVPQIYMLRDGGRYSLLSAVDIDGSVAVGVSVSAPGNFEFRIPDDCDTYDYEVVVLKDAQLGTLTDLKEAPCSVYLPEAGEVNSRFSISFRRIDEASVLDGVQVYTPYEGMFTVEGMRGESVIRYYDASGRMIGQRRSSSYQETFRAVRGVYLVEVECEGMEHAVIKVLVK